MILVLNAGSSSIKYTLFQAEGLAVISKGQVERIGSPEGHFKHRWRSGKESFLEEGALPEVDHPGAFRFMGEKLLATCLSEKSDLAAIGHRLVHGGEQFSDTTLITEEVKQVIRSLIPLAPLHNPPNLQGIEMSEEVFPDALQVGVFDTAFHQTIPEYAYRYAVPELYYREYGIRKYGFHGTSHRYITEVCQAYFQKKEVNLIIAHLGNGASITAVRDGRSVDNSMGMGPLPGLVMGTRSGDLDPSLIFHLVNEHGWSPEKIEEDLNRNSGLKGLCGESDLRKVQQAAGEGDSASRLGLEVYIYRIRQYLGSYLAVLGRVDALVFTAGVGENSPYIRQEVLQGMGHLGFKLDEGMNQAESNEQVSDLATRDSEVRILVIPTDEEKQIAIEVNTLLRSGKEGPS